MLQRGIVQCDSTARSPLYVNLVTHLYTLQLTRQTRPHKIHWFRGWHWGRNINHMNSLLKSPTAAHVSLDWLTWKTAATGVAPIQIQTVIRSRTVAVLWDSGSCLKESTIECPSIAHSSWYPRRYTLWTRQYWAPQAQILSISSTIEYDISDRTKSRFSRSLWEYECNWGVFIPWCSLAENRFFRNRQNPRLARPTWVKDVAKIHTALCESPKRSEKSLTHRIPLGLIPHIGEMQSDIRS